MVNLFPKALAVVFSVVFVGAATAQTALFVKPPVTLASLEATGSANNVHLAAIDKIDGFAEISLPNGGLFTELVATAMIRANDVRDFDIQFINPQNAQISDEMAQGDFDLSFPWFVPDCTNLAPLNASDKAICSKFIASQPYYEVPIGMFVQTGSDLLNATAPQDLINSHICRPAGHIEFDLAQAGLMPPAVMFSTPATLEECLSGLANGLYDVLSVDTEMALKAIEEMGLTGRIQAIESLETVHTLHVLSPRTNPNGRAYLATLNIGMRDMRHSGEWFSIVAKHMSALN